MLRPARLVMMVLLAMFVVAVPNAIAQSPLADQYTTVDDTGTAGTGTGAANDTTAGGGNGSAPVQVRKLSSDQAKGLPFTGGQISLIALIGLGLLAAGTVGVASTRRRTSATSS
jgi:hypothetical protein